MIIRPATEGDIPALKRLLKEMHAEVGIGKFDEERFSNTIQSVCTNSIAIVAEIDGELVGSIGISVDKWWYSNDSFLADVWTFVHPSARNTRAAALMISEARAMAKRLNAPLVLGIFNRVEIERKAKFYARQGLTPMGAWFMQEA